jgi:hypothetical protein
MTHNVIRYDIRRRRGPTGRLGTTDPAAPQYEVTARIVSQTQEDGSPLDTPLLLSTCAPGDPCGSNSDATAAGSMSTADRAAAAARSVTAAMARDGAAAGTGTGAGSGGIYPFAGGLPLILPTLPTAAKYLLYAALAAGGLFVISEARRR